jgi:uncharacterized protein (DUF362 family)
VEDAIKVAVVRSDRRRGAVAEALGLIADDLRSRVQADIRPVLIPNLDHPGRSWTCTHRDTLSATVDALLGAGASEVAIASGPGSRAPRGQDPRETLGYMAELWDRPVRWLDHGREPGAGSSAQDWTTIRWINPGGEPIAFRVPSVVTASRCRVLLGVARTHEVHRLGMALTNFPGILDRDSRVRLGAELMDRGMRSPGIDKATAALESCRGWLERAWLQIRSVSGGMRLTPREGARLQAVEQASRYLVALASFLAPSISLIDGFSVMAGQGPRHGHRVALNTVVAGTDPVAVDAVAAALMGFEPMEVLYLRQAHALGLGTGDLSAITIVGDPLPRRRRHIRRHSSDSLLRLAGSVNTRPASLPRPHFAPVPSMHTDRSTVSSEANHAHRL